ncbi:hypothetical protein ACIQUS_23115 [Pseudomonas sp. NPDC090755]|uniref:hypothetical protein n=1 Tax=Pseudomonas sp. NPDC090755 TaxID=3364481 RepID=UPI00383B7A8B
MNALNRLLAVLLLCLCPLSAQAVEAGEVRQLLARSVSSSAAPALAPADRHWLKRKHQLLLGTSVPDYPPFDINIGGKEYEGLTADFAGLIGELLGVRIEVRRFAIRAPCIQASPAVSIQATYYKAFSPNFSPKQSKQI